MSEMGVQNPFCPGQGGKEGREGPGETAPATLNLITWESGWGTLRVPYWVGTPQDSPFLLHSLLLA